MPENGRPYRELLDLTCLAAKQQVGWDFAQKRARGVFTIKKDYRVLVHKPKKWEEKYWDALFQTKCMKPFWIGKHLVLLCPIYICQTLGGFLFQTKSFPNQVCPTCYSRIPSRIHHTKQPTSTRLTGKGWMQRIQASSNSSGNPGTVTQ